MSEAKFWRKVEQIGDCWQWTAARNSSGYGNFSPTKGVYISAHRYCYELMVGPIPEGLHLDHLCRNRACVNPWHLEPVPHRVNVLRGISPASGHATKTHCPQGHPYDEVNTHVYRNQRNCRACNADRARARRAAARQRKEAAA